MVNHKDWHLDWKSSKDTTFFSIKTDEKQN